MSNLLGRPVILAFYPAADWSPVYGDQMALYNETPPRFESLERNRWDCSSMVPGVKQHLRRPVICVSRCSPILSPN
jgi:hypothetical protein